MCLRLGPGPAEGLLQCWLVACMRSPFREHIAHFDRPANTVVGESFLGPNFALARGGRGGGHSSE